MSTILLVTKTDDNDCVEAVARAIEARGGKAFRFDTDRFPGTTSMSLAESTAGDRRRLRVDGATLDLGDVSAVWYRRMNIGAKLPIEIDAQIRHACVLETRATISGMIASLGVFQLNAPIAVRWGENKELQLAIAREVGLDIPRTLITNDADDVRAFAKECRGGIIGKMLSSFAIREGEEEKVVFTNRIADDDLANLDGLDLAPMTFQEAVTKKLELRVTVVGKKVFTAAIDSAKVKRAEVDWRREGSAMLDDWTRYDLPGDVEEKIGALVDRLSLDYAAIDVILTPDGRHVFLESNPAGEFYWLERCPGLPLTVAIADTLLDPKSRRRGGAPVPLVRG